MFTNLNPALQEFALDIFFADSYTSEMALLKAVLNALPLERRIERVLPISYQQPISHIPLALVAFGLLFGGAPTSMCFLGQIKNISGAQALILLPFALSGAACVLGGLYLFYRRESFVITASSVSYNLQGLFDETRWEEPLSAYRGVANEEIERNRGTSTADYSDWHTEYRIVLKHAADADKDIVLYSSRDGSQIEAELEGLSKLLKLTLLREDPQGGYAQRKPGELDQTLAQRAREGKVSAPFDFAKPIPGQKLRWEHEPEGEALIAPLGGALFALLGAGFVLAGIAMSIFNSLFMGAIFFLMACVFLLFGLAEEALCLGAENARQEYRLGGRTLPGNSMPIGAVKDIFLFSKQGSGREVVRLVSDQVQIDVGQSISHEEKLWLKDFLLAKIAR